MSIFSALFGGKSESEQLAAQIWAIDERAHPVIAGVLAGTLAKSDLPSSTKGMEITGKMAKIHVNGVILPSKSPLFEAFGRSPP